jgi:hypothetical protein
VDLVCHHILILLLYHNISFHILHILLYPMTFQVTKSQMYIPTK